MSPRVPTALLVPIALLVLGASCASTPAPAPGKDASAAKEAKAAKRAADLEQVQLESSIAQLKAATTKLAAQEAVEEAEHDFDEARLALDRFNQFERPNELASAQLSLDRSELSVTQNQAELQQMEEMYAAETNLDATGERTRDIVLERHRKALEFSQRQLELAVRRYQDLEGHELPRKERDLQQKVVKARAETRKAQEKLAQGELEHKLAILKLDARAAELHRESKSKDGTSEDDSK